MKKSYVPKTLTEYLTESKSIPLKRKYGERPAITAGANAPLRNQVLSFVSESGTVSKRDLKQFIMGLKEGGATVAAANMFIKRNSKYFVSELKEGVTYFKLSNLGRRLVNQFIPAEGNVSESVKNARKSLSMILESSRRNRKLNEDEDEEPEETEEFEVPEDEMEDGELEAAEIDGEGPAAEIDFERDEEPEVETEEQSDEADNFEYEEDDEKIVLTYYKNGSGEAEELEPEGEELEPEEGEELEPEEGEELEPEEGEELEPEEGEEDEDLSDRPEDEEPREFDFKDKGRPGLLGMDEGMKAQFVVHNLAGKKSSKLANRYSTSEYHNLLDDKQEKDEKELDKHIVKAKEGKKLHEKSEERLAGRYGKEYHNLLTNDQDSDPKEDELNISEHDRRVQRMKEIIENLKNKRAAMLKEAEEADEKDELKDEDLDSLDLGDETTAEETPEEAPEGEEVEKVEITEFIITVDDVDAAIDELSELGVTAERVPIEKPEEEVPAEVEEEPAPEETPAEEPAPEDAEKQAEVTKEAFRKFVAGILNEAEEAEQPEDLGTSDELGLGDQGEEAPELDAKPEGEETTEPTAEFEENKIKVKAQDWDTLKGWLEEKGVDVKEMFGGDIETEEVDPEEETAEEPAEVSDDDIDFSGIGDDDKTKVKEKEVKEDGYNITAEKRLKGENEETEEEKKTREFHMKGECSTDSKKMKK